MPNITIEIPKSLKEEMKQYPGINWSEIIRQGIQNKIFLNKMDKFLEKSTMTEEDAIILGRKVNQGLAKRYRKYMLQNAKKKH